MVTTTTTTMEVPDASSLRATLERDGFVIIPGALQEPALSSLRAASARATALARAGEWPHIRTLPKQFPPWPADASQGIWGVQHLMHPDMPGRDAFAASYFDGAVVGAVKRILGCDDDADTDADLILELYNLLVRPDADFALRWHRDDIAADASPEQEMERLARPAFHAQWNLPLYDDASLVAVPGSHRRARTPAERAVDPFGTDMPGAVVVPMKAGDVVFYNNNILHRGVYDCRVERMTLHGSIGHVQGSAERARNVIQHGVGAWIDRCSFDGLPDDLRRRAEKMKANLLELGKAGDVGFSHAD